MDLTGQVAVVAGATRGAGRAFAVELARAGAYVYATGRSSRVAGLSDMDRPETIEETGDLLASTGGQGTALRVDHLDVEAVRSLVERVRTEHGRLDVLVNDVFGGDRYAQWDTPFWEHDLEGGCGCFGWASRPTSSPAPSPCRCCWRPALACSSR